MYLTAENILFLGSLLVFVSILISKTSYRFGVPTLLLFLIVGMVFGSDGVGLQFHNAGTTQFVGMLALSVILFTGGMDTKISDIRPIMTQGLILSTVGVVLTTVFVGLFAWALTNFTPLPFEFSLLTSMLLAAMMSSTDSASVFNLLGSQRMNLKENLKPMLELESGSNDPMAYLLTLLLIQLIGSTDDWSASSIAINLVVQFAVGTLIGFAIGKASAWLINRIQLNNQSMYSVLLLSMVFISFTLTEMLQGNPYLAVYITGVVIGNERLVNRKEMNTFMNGLTWLAQIVMFLTLGLLVNPTELVDILLIATLIALFMIFVARPLTVYLCLLPFRDMSNKARLFVSWVGLRGAVPIIFATYPILADIPQAHTLFNIIFTITLISLLLQGMSISWMAKRLNLDLPEEKDGNEFGVELPEELETNLSDLVLTPEMLANGNRLMDMDIPENTLVIMIKRGTEYIVPNGQAQLQVGDVLLFMSKEDLSF
ncbi:MAG: potassium/proton antiporter [Bacteroidaceae bacterium]|nr:potassium/proton antiporter [Bacteroidaceae bacterium]